MKKILLLINLLVLVTIGCTNKSSITDRNYTNSAYSCKSIETLKDSKGRPHKIVVFQDPYGLCAIDLDANTYK